MCRIAAYSGPDIALEEILLRPPHSLVSQSRNATEAKLSVNGDGFGIAWYSAAHAEPGLYRETLPAWSDTNLVSLCRMVRTSHFIAHVRASTMGETSRANCHPFTSGRWAFCHNGQIPHFPRLRRGMEAELSDALYDQRRGTTDSEMVFLTLLQSGLHTDPQAAMRATLARIGPPGPEGPVRLTCVFSNGQTLWGGRFASDDRAPTLYVTQRDGASILASEPLWRDVSDWQLLPQGTLVSIGPDGTIRDHDLLASAA